MKRVAFFLLSLSLVPCDALLFGQSTFGVIRGTVRDSGDAVIVGAMVTVTSEGTRIARQASTDQFGSYEVGHLNPGLYTLAVEASGFQRHLHQGINLETGQTLRLDVALKVGQLIETVTVTGEAPAIETETGTISDVRTGRQLRELPSQAIVRADANSGGIYFLMGLSPGNIRHEGTSSHTYNGTRANQSTQIFDGTQLGDQRGTQVSFSQPSFETIQEMKLASVNNSAEYSTVAAVILTSRSGTNELHGSGFYQYNSGSLNARNFFAASSPWRVLNEFGGRLGGPVLLPGYDGRNRTFFFGAFEGTRDHTLRLYNASVPTLALRDGNFSALPVSVRDPSNNQPFPGNVIPSSRISPVSSRVQERYFPLPNFGPPSQLQQNVRDQLTNAPSWNHFDARVDHRFNDQNSMFARFSWRGLDNSTADGDLPNTGYMYRTRQIHNLSLVDTHIVSPGVVNEARLGYAWHELPRWGPRRGLAEVQALGIQGLTSGADLNVAPVFQIVDFTTITQIEYNTPAHMVYDIHDVVTVIKGRHSLRTGFNYRRNFDASNPIPHSVYGTYQFTGTYTGFSYSDFLLGIPQQTTRSTPRGRTYGRNQFWAGFIQDDFKVHPSLTLNLGLRYEWMNPFAEINDQMYNFDQQTGTLVVPTQHVLERDVSRILPGSIQIVTADQAGFPRRGLRRGDNNNFDPRVGAAWRPFGNSRTVVRGAFGVYRNILSGATFGPLVVGGPFVSDELFVNRIDNGVPLFQFPRPFLAAGSPGAVNVTGVDPNLFNPYTMQWNFTLEREYAGMGLRTSYIATRSVNLLYRRNFNQPVPSVEPFNNDRRPFPQYRNVTIASNGGSSTYHSLQFEAERKFARGLFYQVGWTWAKQLAHGRDSGELGALVENAYNRDAEWGDDDYFMRHRVVGNFVWETPFGPGRKWGHGLLGKIAGGWNLSGIAMLQTGQRFTPTFTGRDPSNTQTVGGRPDRIENGNLPKGERTIDQWFDVSAFAVPPVNAGRFGNAGNGILEGPGTKVFSFGLFKNFWLREKTRLEFSINTTNTFNTPNFRNPNANIASLTQRGRITSTQGMDVAGARTVVFGTRIEF